MKYLFASFLICLSVSVNAQQHHFIYIQADNRQPFYVKFDKKILSSSASGYLIIPQLVDSSYDLSIGFPKNEWPEQKVTCSINNNDLGYLLKNFGEKGWGLFNFQTMDLVMADTKNNADSNKTRANTEDAFSNALANVVNDPAIKAVEEVKDDSATAKIPVKKAAVKKDAKAIAKSKSPALNKNKEHISKLVSRRNADGLKMVYVDKINGSVDTINIVIPIEKSVVKVIPAKLDTAAALDKQAIAKHTPSVKKPVKKPANVKTNIAKTDKKIAEKGNEPAIVILPPPAVPVEIPKTDIVLENKNPVSSADTTAAVQPAKKIEDIIAEMAKTDANSPNKDSIVTVQPEIKTEENKTDIVVEKKTDALTVDTIAMKLVDTIAMNPVDVAVELPKDNKLSSASTDSSTKNISSIQTEEQKADIVKEDLQAKTAVDSTANIAPEIKIEQSKPETVKETVKEPVIQAADSAAMTNNVNPDVKKVETIVPDKTVNDQVVVEKPKEDIVPKTNSAPTVPTYSCKYVADGDEFMSLRKKMLKGKTDNEMLFYAHQLFLKRCVTTKQVERLCLLFNNDLARYNLFDDAYHFIADPDVFPTLESQLNDQYYVKRFKAMLRQ